jgi:hypothetical protein
LGLVEAPGPDVAWVPDGCFVSEKYPYNPSPPQYSKGKPGHFISHWDVDTEEPGAKFEHQHRSFWMMAKA